MPKQENISAVILQRFGTKQSGSNHAVNRRIGQNLKKLRMNFLVQNLLFWIEMSGNLGLEENNELARKILLRLKRDFIAKKSGLKKIKYAHD